MAAETIVASNVDVIKNPPLKIKLKFFRPTPVLG